MDLDGFLGDRTFAILDGVLPNVREVSQLELLAVLIRCSFLRNPRSFVSPNFLDSEFLLIEAMVAKIRYAHFRLVFIAGGTSPDRSLYLNHIASNLGCPVLNVGKVLSGRLLDQSPSLRSASAEEAFYEILDAAESDLVCLDHLEILFDKALMLKAVELIKNASRRFILVASWPGVAEAGKLIFGPPDHPSHFRMSWSELECPAHILSTS